MINMSKGDAPVLLTKTPLVKATVRWSSHTDYDLYALVLYADGGTETVAMFPAAGQPAQSTTSRFPGAVRHLGDVGRTGSGAAEEVLEIRLTDAIRAVVPVAYSAQSNGTGSFHEYAVSMEIDNGVPEQSVSVSATHANADSRVYSCAVGIVENTPTGVLVHALEEYSKPGSENRPTVKLGRRKGWGAPKEPVVQVAMDQGPVNAYK
jgi:uncharacterized protein involved in tellurium resistance